MIRRLIVVKLADKEDTIITKLPGKEDMIVGVDIGMMALFSRHTSHAFLYFQGYMDIHYQEHAPFLWR